MIATEIPGSKQVIFMHLFLCCVFSAFVIGGFTRLARTRWLRRFRFLQYAKIGGSGRRSLHTSEHCNLFQCFLMNLFKLGLVGLYVRQDCFLQNEARVCVSNAFVIGESKFKWYFLLWKMSKWQRKQMCLFSLLLIVQQFYTCSLDLLKSHWAHAP